MYKNRVPLWFVLFFLVALPQGTYAWDEGLSHQLAKLLCADNYYYRTCFGVKKNPCEKAALAKAKICKEKHGRNVVRGPDAERIANQEALQMGYCVGNELEKQWAEQRSNKRKCSQIGSWQ